MRRLITYLAILVITSVALSFTQKDTTKIDLREMQVESVQDPYMLVRSIIDSTKPKEYPVNFPISKWDGYYRGLEFAISELWASDRPAKNIKFLIDSILTPLQQQILFQLQRQLQAEEAQKKKPPSGKN